MADKDKGMGQLKKVVSGLDNNRKNIEAKTDIPANISQAKDSFSEYEGIIKGQTGTISSLRAF